MTLPTAAPFFFTAGFIGNDADKASIPQIPLLALYYAVDTTAFYVYDGTTWQPIGGGGGGGIASWGQVSTSQYSGSGSPVGAVTPDAEGDLYLDTTTPAVWQATGTGDTDWQNISSGALPSWFLFGVGSPQGAVTPTGPAPALYFDTASGALYSNNDGTDTGWVLAGGEGDQTITGFYADLANAVMTAGSAGQASLSDVLAFGNSGNGIFWVVNGADGAQIAGVQTGPGGAFVGILQDATGKMTPATTIDPTNFPTADPVDGGHSLWNDAGTIKVST